MFVFSAKLVRENKSYSCDL